MFWKYVWMIILFLYVVQPAGGCSFWMVCCLIELFPRSVLAFWVIEIHL
jgi:hypothetical protein